MSEFGHIHGNGRGVFFDGWGVGPYIIVAGGKTFYFEDSARFGPVPVDVRTGDPTSAGYFPERSPFWGVWRRWKDEGRQTTEGKKKGWLYCVVSNGRVAPTDGAVK